MSTKYQRPGSSYTGVSALSNRTKYQDDASAIPKVAISSTKVDGDFNYIVDALNTIDEASGSRASIDDRLNVSLNADGTLKVSVAAAPDDWLEHSGITPIRVDDTSIKFAGDHTALYHANRRVRLTIGGSSYYATVASSTYATSETTIILQEIVDSTGSVSVVSTNPTAVAYSPFQVGATGNSQTTFTVHKVRGADPLLRLKDTDGGGKEFAMQSAGGSLKFVENTGTEAVPIWTERSAITSSGFSINDGTVTVANMADGTAGEIFSWDASGVAATIATGTAGQVLTSGGAGSAPSFQTVLPSGVVVPFAGSSIPAGWLVCDGTAVNRTTYAELFSAIGTTYGVGDGSTTFNVPDLRGRGAYGLDDMGGVAASRLAAATSLGQAAGAESASGSTDGHTLTISEMPAHTHELPVTASRYDGSSGSDGGLGNSGYSSANVTDSVGDGGAHSHNITNLATMPPYLALNFMIKV